jgi:hypothetical protein
VQEPRLRPAFAPHAHICTRWCRMTDEPPDVLSVISRDLAAVRSRRRRHFAPAIVLALAILGGAILASGLRPDLLDQPTWQIALQGLTWLVCLVLFPLVGVGLWFPRRGTRILLAFGGVALAVTSAVGIPFGGDGVHATDEGGPCWLVLAGCGLALLGVGAWSGAFAERRARSSTFWIAAGLALAALEVVTWTCPSHETEHVVTSHFGPTLLVVLVAAAAGSLLHRRCRRTSSARS